MNPSRWRDGAVTVVCAPSFPRIRGVLTGLSASWRASGLRRDCRPVLALDTTAARAAARRPARLRALGDVPNLVRRNAAAWGEVLQREDVTVRPNSETWSALEYSAHVRDVFRIFRARLEQMLQFDDPHFENWDQDATAIADRYNEQDSATVASELADAAEAVASAFESVAEGQLGRRGLRSDGSAFTVESLAMYFIHDPIHHLHDVSG